MVKNAMNTATMYEIDAMRSCTIQQQFNERNVSWIHDLKTKPITQVIGLNNLGNTCFMV